MCRAHARALCGTFQAQGRHSLDDWMSIYANIKRCLELSDRDITSAIADRRLAKALLDQLAKVSKPGDGAPKLLLMFAKIAAQQVDWIDGALRVELVADGETTVVEVLTELGLGMHERVFPSFKMNVPLEEFARAVERVPHMIEPLSIGASSEKRLVLTASEEREEEESEDDSSSGNVAIADESMYAAEKRTASKDKMPAVHASSAPKMRAAKKPSKPEMAEMAAAALVPKVIASRSGKTLRPEAPKPSAPRGAPIVVPRAPALPRAEQRAVDHAASEPKRSVVARVPLHRIQVPRSAASGSRPPPPRAPNPPKAPPPTPKHPSKPPAKRASMKPPPSSRGGRASKIPPPRAPSGRPPRSVAPKGAAPKSKRGTSMSEPPDEESIDTGWDDES
jgi:hypothetical protein